MGVPGMRRGGLVGWSTGLINAQLATDLVSIGWTPGLSSSLGGFAGIIKFTAPAVIWTPDREKYDLVQPSTRPPAGADAAIRQLKTALGLFHVHLWWLFSNLPTSGQLQNQPVAGGYSALEILQRQLLVAMP